MLVSYMPLAANARELDELGSRNKPTSPDVGGCRERFYLGGGMLLRKTRPAPAADESATHDVFTPVTVDVGRRHNSQAKTHYISYFFLQ